MKPSRFIFFVGIFFSLSWVFYVGLFQVDIDQVGKHSTTETTSGNDTRVNISEQKQDFAALKTEMSLLRAAIKSMQQKSASLETQLALLAMNVRNNSGIDFEGSAENAVTGLDMAESITVEEEEDKMEMRLQSLATSLQSEQVDPQWQVNVTDVIEKAFESDELEGIAISEVECRATLCRVEAEYDDPNKLDEFELWFPDKVSSMLPRLTMNRIDEGNGVYRTIIYLARDGFRLPNNDAIE